MRYLSIVHPVYIRTVLATASITFKDTTRHVGFWIASLSFILAASLSNIPFSPGISADRSQYSEAGIATLLLGGLFLSLMLIPLLLCGKENTIGALPVHRNAIVLGIYAGFAKALFLYFFFGAAFLAAITLGLGYEFELKDWISDVAWSLYTDLISAALILLAAHYLAYAPAIIVSMLVIFMGYASIYIPFPFSIFFPAMGFIDPLVIKERSTSETLLAIVHGGVVIGLYISLASLGPRKRLSH